MANSNSDLNPELVEKYLASMGLTVIPSTSFKVLAQHRPDIDFLQKHIYGYLQTIVGDCDHQRKAKQGCEVCAEFVHCEGALRFTIEVKRVIKWGESPVIKECCPEAMLAAEIEGCRPGVNGCLD